MNEARSTKPQTKLIHAARELDGTRAISSPIWQTTSFEAESAQAFADVAQKIHPAEYYTRYGNPGHQQAEATLAAIEGGEAAMVTGSGMGAIFTAVMSLLEKGDHVIAQRNLYASAATLFEEIVPRWGDQMHVRRSGDDRRVRCCGSTEHETDLHGVAK